MRWHWLVGRFGGCSVSQLSASSVSLFLLGLSSCAAYWVGIAGMSVAPKWASFAILVPTILLISANQKGKWSGLPKVPILLLVMFLAYATASLYWTTAGIQAYDSLYRLYLISGMILVGMTTASLIPLYLGAGLGLILSSGTNLVEAFGYVFKDTWSQPYSGLFFSPNFLCEAAVLVAIALVAKGYWKLALLSVPAIALSHSRGALVAGAVAFVCWVWPRSKFWAAVVVICGLAIGGLVATKSDYHSGSVAQRIAIWTDTISGLSWKGLGVGSFHYEFPRFAKHYDTFAERPDQAHNDTLQLAFEFGAGSLPLLILVALALFGAAEVERLVLIAFLVESMFEFPLYLPTTALLGAVAVGYLFRSGHRIFSHNTNSGMVLQGRSTSSRTRWGRLSWSKANGNSGEISPGTRLPARWTISSGDDKRWEHNY